VAEVSGNHVSDAGEVGWQKYAGALPSQLGLVAGEFYFAESSKINQLHDVTYEMTTTSHQCVGYWL